MRRAIYTVNVGGYDKIRPAPDFPDWDAVLFTDRPLPWHAQMGLGRKWRVVQFDVAGLAPSVASRRPKLLPHLYLGEYDYSLYVDANIVFPGDPALLAERLGWPDFAAARHPYRTNPYQEAAECITQAKAPPAILDEQMAVYRAAGLPEDAPLYENNVLLRRHGANHVVTLNQAWWEEFMRFPYRDQISLPYASFRTGIVPMAFDQDLKRRFVVAKAHDRSLGRRLLRSARKRLSRLGLA